MKKNTGTRGNVSLDTLMSMLSGLGAGGGIGVPNTSNGLYFVYYIWRTCLLFLTSLCWFIIISDDFVLVKIFSATRGTLCNTAHSAPGNGFHRHCGEHPSTGRHCWECTCRGGAPSWESWPVAKADQTLPITFTISHICKCLFS